MERLTYIKCPHRWDSGRSPSKYTSRHTFQEVAARLAAYEDTGLCPETAEQLKEIVRIFNCDPNDPTQLKQICDKLQDWQQAEQDGRLVVLPEAPKKKGADT